MEEYASFAPIGIDILEDEIVGDQSHKAIAILGGNK